MRTVKRNSGNAPASAFSSSYRTRLVKWSGGPVLRGVEFATFLFLFCQFYVEKTGFMLLLYIEPVYNVDTL
jgi:hypothetical protein